MNEAFDTYILPKREPYGLFVLLVQLDFTIGDLETDNLNIYFAHPYFAWERGSNERHNGLLCRFIPKGLPIKSISEDTLRRTVRWCNSLPRKILNYRTPQEVFLEEVSKVVDLKSVQFDIAI